MHLFISIIFLIVVSSDLLRAQIVYTPSEHFVYEFLERISLKRIIEYHNEVKPISRVQIAELLNQVRQKKEELNSIELKELDWLFEEYAYELKTNFPGLEVIHERWFLYSYSDSVFTLKVSPLGGYGISGSGSDLGHTRWWGADIYATYSDVFGMSFNARDRGEFGDNADKQKAFTPVTGRSFINVSNGIEYSDVRGNITLNWQWGHISLIKDYLEWGHGKFGQVILSKKAPSFPFIRLDLYPAEWLRFYYIHGWLNSLVYDSSAFFYNNTESLRPYLRKEYVNKYIAANFLSISPFNWLDLSIGNSIIYSGKLRPEFFIPFMFFKYLDRDTGHGSVGDGNGQLFLDLSVNYPKTSKFYSTLFVDVAEIRNIIKNDFHNTWFGFTLGMKKIDLAADNLDLTIEYTRINPWVYEHKDETTTYKHVNYYLGHWIGQNADQLRMQFDYRPIRGLKLKAYTEFIRKGRLNDIYFAYNDKHKESFLSHPVRKEIRFSFEASYEIIHDLFADGYYSYSDVKDEDLTRTPEFLLGKKHSFGVTVHYGL